MRYLKAASVAVISIAALAIAMAGSASATVLCNTTTTPCESQVAAGAKIDASLTKFAVRDTSGFIKDTCTGGTLEASVTNAGSATEAVSASIKALTWSGCTNTTTTIKAGVLSVTQIEATDNGTLTAKNTEVTIEIGGVDCTYGTGSGLDLGSLKGGTSPTISINAAVNGAGPLGCPTTLRLEAEYTVNEPKPLYVEPEATGNALCTTTTTPCESSSATDTTLDASLSGSMRIRDTSGFIKDTCTGGTLQATLKNTGLGAEPISGPINALSWSGCTHSTATVNLGELEIDKIAGTDNGTVTSRTTELTFELESSSCSYGVGSGLDLGTLKGGTAPTISINAVVNKVSGGILCPSTVRWEAEYTVNQPKPLYVESEGTGAVLCTTTSTPCETPTTTDTTLDASLTKFAIRDTSGFIKDTCTGGTLQATLKYTSSGTEPISGPINALSWSGCTNTTATLKTGELEIDKIAGTDNGTLTAKNTEVTIETGGFDCTYGTGSGLDLGSLKGGTSPTISINAAVNKVAGSIFCPATIRLEAEYTVNEPKPLYVEPI